MTWTPPMPSPEEVREEERADYDGVVERQTAYGYSDFVKRFQHDSVLRAFPGDRVQPYFGALLNSPPLAAGISNLGAVYRARGERPGGMTHADREWIDMVICDELECNWVLYVHAPDATASGVRSEAILAVVEGREDDLTAEERLKADFIRAFCRGAVDGEMYDALQQELGVRGAVEFTAFCGHLLMTLRLIQAYGVEDIEHHELVEFVQAVVDGRVEIPEAARVSTVPAESGSS